jgi:hypothetical protein
LTRETSHFDDAEQFLTSKNEAVAQLVKHDEASAAWVDVTGANRIPDWLRAKKSRMLDQGRPANELMARWRKSEGKPI